MSKLFLICGPSGSGKTTLSKMMGDAGACEVISTTTRAPRAGERDGVQYHFTTPEQFELIKKSGGFLESATFGSNSYGMQTDSVLSILETGKDAVAVVEIQGILSVREALSSASDARLRDVELVSIFMHVPFETAKSRLIARDVDVKPDVLKWRIENINNELKNKVYFEDRKDSIILENPDLKTLENIASSLVAQSNEKLTKEHWTPQI